MQNGYATAGYCSGLASAVAELKSQSTAALDITRTCIVNSLVCEFSGEDSDEESAVVTEPLPGFGAQLGVQQAAHGARGVLVKDILDAEQQLQARPLFGAEHAQPRHLQHEVILCTACCLGSYTADPSLALLQHYCAL